MSSAERPGVPGNKGLMFGDILGSKAGETATELTLPRFLLPRGANMGVFLRFGVPAPLGRICGLALDGARRGDGFGKIGDGKGWSAETLAVSISGGELELA